MTWAPAAPPSRQRCLLAVTAGPLQHWETRCASWLGACLTLSLAASFNWSIVPYVGCGLTVIKKPAQILTDQETTPGLRKKRRLSYFGALEFLKRASKHTIAAILARAIRRPVRNCRVPTSETEGRLPKQGSCESSERETYGKIERWLY